MRKLFLKNLLTILWFGSVISCQQFGSTQSLYDISYNEQSLTKKRMRVKSYEISQPKKIKLKKLKIRYRDIIKSDYNKLVYTVPQESFGKHYGYELVLKTDQIAWLAKYNDFQHSEVVHQTVSTQLSSNQKSNEQLLKEFKNDELDINKLALDIINKESAKSDLDPKAFSDRSKKDVLVFYNYEDGGEKEGSQTITQVSKKKLSQNVNNVISRVMGQSASSNRSSQGLVKINDYRNFAKPSNDLPPEVKKIVNHLRKGKKPKKEAPNNPLSKITDSVKLGLSSVEGSSSLDLSYTSINSFGVTTDKYSGDKITNFEFIPEFDKSIDRLTSDPTGKLSLETPIKDELATLRGSLVSKGFAPTKIDLPLLMDEQDYSVPMFSSDWLLKLFEENEVDDLLGHILVEMQENVDDVLIDQEAAAIVYLNEDFKVVEKDKGFVYLFFLGVAGNVTIEFLTEKGDVAQKTVHVAEEEIYFTKGLVLENEVDILKISETYTLGKKNRPLNIDANNISFLNSTKPSLKEGLNSYEIVTPPLAAGSRKYAVLKHLKDHLFIGYSEVKKIEIPSGDSIGEILRYFDISELDQQCLVQVNFSETPVDVTVNGEHSRDSMAFDKKFLGEDGIVYNELNLDTKKAFLTSNIDGLFSLKVEYADGSFNFFNTYCKPGTYLVEQL